MEYKCMARKNKDSSNRTIKQTGLFVFITSIYLASLECFVLGSEQVIVQSLKSIAKAHDHPAILLSV